MLSNLNIDLDTFVVKVLHRRVLEHQPLIVMSDFKLAHRVGHLIVQTADLQHDPPESYLFIQDGLIVACGVLYAMCYFFCMLRTYRDKTYPGASYGGIQYL